MLVLLKSSGADLLLKSHVNGYTKADGTQVAAYERKGEVGSLKDHWLRPLAEHADVHLEGPAAKAISGFIGHEPRALEEGGSFGLMSARALEDAFSEKPSDKGLAIRADLEQAFAPVREAIRAKIGDRVQLYRVQRAIDPVKPNSLNASQAPDGTRSVLSWTSDLAFAEHWVGIRPDRTLFSEDEIAAAEAEFAQNGKVQVTKNHALVLEHHPAGFGFSTGDPYPAFTSVNITLPNGDVVTDTDSVRAYMEGLNEERAEHNADQAKRRAMIRSASIPLDDVVWVSDRAGQSEFIVHNRGAHAIHPEPLTKATSAGKLLLRLRDPNEPTDDQKRAGNYQKRKLAWQGLVISVENEAGDVRRGVGADGHWATRLFYAYGYINGSNGVDGDQVDVYLGPELETAPMVYVVHQRRYGAWSEYDEDKCMLGFRSEEDAVDAYLSCYDDPRFLGPVTAMPVEDFVEKVRATKDGAMMIKSLVAPHLRDGRLIRAYDNHRTRRARPAKQVDLFSAGGDPFHERLERLKARVVRHASGLSMEKDFTPTAHSGHAVGVEIGELSEKGMDRLAQAVVDWKTPLFVDSGMFGRFMSGVRSGTPSSVMDFASEVFPKYDRLTLKIHDLNDAGEALPPPLLVMPDVVGDQIASLNLIAHHRSYVRATIDFSGVARAIIPIQRGPLSMADAYRELVRILGTDDFIVGVPSNAAATTPEEFVEFLRDAKPRGVHILGALADSRLTPRLSQIVESGHEPEHISADANPLRSIIIEKGQSADQRAAKLRDRMGERARQAELEAWIEHNGGIENVRDSFAAANPEWQARILGLFMDLSGLEPDAVKRQYGLA